MRDTPNNESDDPGAARRDPTDEEAFAERLGVPSDPRLIYLEEASLYRPIATGDVFQDINVPGSFPEEDAFRLAMVIAHPSVMRRGARLEQRARAAPVVAQEGLSRTKWATKHYDYFPLPRLAAVAANNGHSIDDVPWGAQLQLGAPIETARLDLKRRVACLSPDGICLLLQRLVHADTRCAVREELITRVITPKLNELELLQDWNEELVEPNVDRGANLEDELQQAAEHFDAALNEIKGQDGTSLRVMLESGRRQGEVRRLLGQEINRRRGA